MKKASSIFQKTRHTTARSTRRANAKRGSALVMAVVFTAIIGSTVAYVLLGSNRQTRNTFRARLMDTSLAASASMVKAMSQQAYYLATTRPSQLGGSFANMDSMIEGIDPASIPGFVAVKNGNKDLAFLKTADDGGGNWGVIDDATDDWNGFAIRRWSYDAVAFVNEQDDADNSEVSHRAERMGFDGAGFKSKIQINYIPLYQYAIFYENDLEIHPGPKMEVLGPVHGNSTVWVATGDTSLTFFDRVSSAGNMRTERDFKAIDTSKGNYSIGGNLAVNAVGHDMDANHTKPVYVKKTGSDDLVALNRDLANGVDTNGNTFIDSLDNNWLENALDSFGGALSDQAMGNKPIRPPLPFVGEGEDRRQADASELIQRINPNDPADLKAVKMESMADVLITGDPTQVDDDGYLNDISIEKLTYDSDGNITGRTEIPNRVLVDGEPSGDPIVSQGTFVDNREKKLVYSFDIDAGQLNSRSETSGAIADGNGVVYVSTDNNTDPDDNMNAVRLQNATELPKSRENALTLATDRPMYLEGDVNTTDKGTLLLAADAITVTSQELKLNDEGKTPKQNANRNTTTNAIFMLGQVSSKYQPVDEHGNVTSYAGEDRLDHFEDGYGRVSQSGGAHNVLRYLENWGGKTHTYNGSLICLFESRIAKTKFGGSYYNPPTRDYNWDADLKDAAPPKGMPVLVEVKQTPLERINKAEAIALAQ